VTVWAAIPLVSCLLFAVLAIVALRQEARRVNRVFALFLVASSIWSFTSFMLHLNPYPRYALLWNEILAATLVWTVVSYYHFVRAYNNKPGGLGLYLGYGAVFTILALALNGYIIEYAYVINGVLYHGVGFSGYVIGGISAGFLISAILGLTNRHRKSIDAVDRNRTTYLVVGSVIVIVSTYVTNLTPAISGLSIDHVGNMINAGIIAYAITKYQLLNIRFLARKVLAYGFLLACIGGMYIGLLLLGQRFLPSQPSYIPISHNIGVVIFLALLARPLFLKIEDWVYRSFHWRTYKYRRALIDFRERMSHVINLDELAKEMLNAMTKALHLTEAKLFFQDFSSGGYTTKFAYPKMKDEPSEEVKFNADNPIVSWLDKKAEPLALGSIDSMPEFKGLWELEKEQLATSHLGLLCPIKSQNRLIAIIGLGKKKPGTLYSHEDLELVMSMANQASTIIENAQLYSQAVTRANTDGLTGLYNHRHFHERLDHEIARGSRFGTTFSLIMLDIDLFKAYNDIHGHLAGDEVLRRIAICIETSIRGIDIAFRYGGEEFAIILPEARLDDAHKVAERIRKTIAAKTSSKAPPITASLGVANWPIDGVMKEEIVSFADAALYRAKQTGRNRTCLSSDVVKPEAPLISVELEARSRALSIIYALAATVDAKDHYTYGHSKKVSDYAVALSEAMGLPHDKIDIIRAAGLLHDIGKVGIPDSILNKKGTLNNEEWKLIKAHPNLGVEILRHVIDLVNCLPVILHHHERYDGTGYPSGLKGENIPLEARILSVADAFDAITSPRPYREQLSSQQALDELKRCVGTQFDPKVIEVFKKIMTPAPVRRLESRRR
jgi:diguanylate cyclase (GGDEF)-like protein/putative nucleotidyltransferase with HDIG domain